MPEGDTVWQAARRLDDALTGKTLTRSDIRVPAYATVDLSGRTVEGTVSRGKHLLTRVGEHTLHSHLKMEGSWRVFAPGERWSRPAQLARAVLETADAVAVGFELGLFEIIPRAQEDSVLGYLGPDLLGEGWDADEAVRRVAAAPELPIAVALLDQRNIAGLGNVYVNELCFLRGVLPWRPVGDVPDLPAMLALGKRMITANRDRVARVTTGVDRRGRRLWVYGREGEPCRRCGTLIERGELGRPATSSGSPSTRSGTPATRSGPAVQERVIYWCPFCQR